MDGEPALSAQGGAVKAAGLRQRYAGERQRGENAFGYFSRKKSSSRIKKGINPKLRSLKRETSSSEVRQGIIDEHKKARKSGLF